MTQPSRIIIQPDANGAWRATATGLTRAEASRAIRLALIDLVHHTSRPDDIPPALAAAYPRLTALLRNEVTP